MLRFFLPILVFQLVYTAVTFQQQESREDNSSFLSFYHSLPSHFSSSPLIITEGETEIESKQSIPSTVLLDLDVLFSKFLFSTNIKVREIPSLSENITSLPLFYQYRNLLI